MNNEVATALTSDVINAWKDRQWSSRLDSPEWMTGAIQIHHESMPCSARAIEHRPRRMVPRTNEHHTSVRQVISHLVPGRDLSDNPPATPEKR